MAKPIDLLEAPTRLYPTIKHSLCLSRSLEVGYSTTDNQTLNLVVSVWRHLKENIGLYIPFLLHSLGNEQLFQNDPSSDDWFLRLIPNGLHQQGNNNWIHAIKLLATSLTPFVYKPPLQRTTSDIRIGCRALAMALAVHEQLLHHSNDHHHLPLDAQLAFETETVAVIISDDLIVVPKLSKSLRDYLAGVNCDPTFARAVRQRLIADSEIGDIGDASVDVYDILQPTFEMCESAIVLKGTNERKDFLGHLLDLVIFEGGVEEAALHRPRYKSRVDSYRAGGALNLTTLHYVASSCPLPGLAVSVPAFDFTAPSDGSKHMTGNDLCCIVTPEVPLLPIQLAKLTVALHFMTKVSSGPQTCVALSFDLTDTSRRVQTRMHQAVSGVPAGMHITHRGIRSYLETFKAWSETILFGNVGQIVTRRALKEREKIARLSQVVTSPSVPATPGRRRRALLSLSESENVQPSAPRPRSQTRVRNRNGGRARPGMRVSEMKGQESKEQSQSEQIAESKRLDRMAQQVASGAGSSGDLNEVLPDTISMGLYSVMGLRLFCLGRFPHLRLNGAPFSVFVEGTGLDLINQEQVVASSRLLVLLMGTVQVFVISPYLYDEYTDILTLARKARGEDPMNPTDIDSQELYTRLYKLLPSDRCRSPHWLVSLSRAYKYFPTSDIWNTGNMLNWMDCSSLPIGLNTPLNNALLFENGYIRDRSLFNITPSRGLFLLAAPSSYTMHDATIASKMLGSGGGAITPKGQNSAIPSLGGDHQLMIYTDPEDLPTGPDDEAPRILGENILLSYPSREVLGRIVRSPTRNILVSGRMGRAVLRPLLNSVKGQEPTAPKIVRVMVVVPRGVLLEELDSEEDLTKDTWNTLNNGIFDDLEPLLTLQKEFGSDILKVETVSYTWVEECYLQGEGIDYRSYVVTLDKERKGWRYVVEDRDSKRRISENSYAGDCNRKLRKIINF